MKKRIFVGIVVLVALVCGMATRTFETMPSFTEISFRIGDSMLNINGTLTEVEKPYIVGEGTTLVPLRVITEAFGSKVTWNEEEQSILLEYRDKVILLAIGKNIAITDGKQHIMTAAPELTKKGVTMVPLRFIAETFGAEVSWRDGSIIVRETVYDGAVTEASDAYKKKIWIAYGDSITDKDFKTTKKYVDLLADDLGFGWAINYGLASSDIAHTNGEQARCGVEMYTDHQTERADLITLFFGTNDWFNNIPIGNPYDESTSTLWGAFNYIIGDIKEKQPFCKIIIITPIWRDYPSSSTGGQLPYVENGNGDTFEHYANTIETIARYHGLPCINLYRMLNIRQNSPDEPYPIKYTLDNLHPDQDGQNLIAGMLKPIIIQEMAEAELERAAATEAAYSSDVQTETTAVTAESPAAVPSAASSTPDTVTASSSPAPVQAAAPAASATPAAELKASSAPTAAAVTAAPKASQASNK